MAIVPFVIAVGAFAVTVLAWRSGSLELRILRAIGMAALLMSFWFLFLRGTNSAAMFAGVAALAMGLAAVARAKG